MHLNTQYKLNGEIQENGQQLKLPRTVSNWRVMVTTKEEKELLKYF